MTRPSPLARAIAEEWHSDHSDLTDELAALIDAHLVAVRGVLGGYVVLGKGKCSIGKMQADFGLSALTSLTPEDGE